MIINYNSARLLRLKQAEILYKSVQSLNINGGGTLKPNVRDESLLPADRQPLYSGREQESLARNLQRLACRFRFG